MLRASQVDRHVGWLSVEHQRQQRQQEHNENRMAASSQRPPCCKPIASCTTAQPNNPQRSPVLKVDVADGDDDGVSVVAPREAALLEPLKVGGVAHLLAHQVLAGLLGKGGGGKAGL